MKYSDVDKALLSKVEDAVYLADKHCSTRYVGFLTPYERSFIEKSINGFTGVKYFFNGGYGEAERSLFIAYPDYIGDDEMDLPISVLEITGRDISGLSHRDFLGSILGLGLRRDKIGDIVVFDDRCIVFVIDDIADYIKQNLSKIGRCGIKAAIFDTKEIELPQISSQELIGTVSSLRLDSVLALSLKSSRTKAVELIKSSRVSVNWQVKEDVSIILKVGDVISVRGYGRFKLNQINGMTKKKRYSVCLLKYI